MSLRSPWSGFVRPPRNCRPASAAATRARHPVPATREAWLSLARRVCAGRRDLRTDRQGSVITRELVDRIKDALRVVVVDPELGHNIVDLGFAYDISVKDGATRIIMTATTPGRHAVRAERWLRLYRDDVRSAVDAIPRRGDRPSLARLCGSQLRAEIEAARSRSTMKTRATAAALGAGSYRFIRP